MEYRNTRHFSLEFKDIPDSQSLGRVAPEDKQKSYASQGGVFCISCFHEVYTRWRLDHGIIDQQTANNLLNYARTDTPQDMINRRSVENKTTGPINYKSWNWVNESLSDLSDLMLTNVTEWNGGSIFPKRNLSQLENNRQVLSAEEIDLVTVFKFYEATLELASRKIKSNNMEQSVNKIIVETLISNQKQRLKDELSLMIKDEYFIIDRPYGVLVYSSGLDQHKLIDEYLLNFYLRTIRDIVETIGLTKNDFQDIGHIPNTLERRIFSLSHSKP